MSEKWYLVKVKDDSAGTDPLGGLAAINFFIMLIWMIWIHPGSIGIWYLLLAFLVAGIVLLGTVVIWWPFTIVTGLIVWNWLS